MKKLLVLILALAVVFTFAGCSGSEDFAPDLSDLPTIAGADFETLIDDYVEDSFNVVNLKSGDKEKPAKADYMLALGAKCYSSDESVATVSDSGTIKAVGKGTCYIAMVGNGVFGLKSEVYKVTVDAGILQKLQSGDMGALSEVFGIVFGVFFVGIICVIVFFVVKIAKSNKTSAPGFDTPISQQPGFKMPPMGNQPSDLGGVNHVNGGAAAEKVCPSCGQKAEGAFCPYCGAKLN